jgi:hypothetical protein
MAKQLWNDAPREVCLKVFNFAKDLAEHGGFNWWTGYHVFEAIRSIT